MVEKTKSAVTRWEAQFLFVTNGVAKGDIGPIRAMEDCLRIAKRMVREYSSIARSSEPHYKEVMSWED